MLAQVSCRVAGCSPDTCPDSLGVLIKQHPWQRTHTAAQWFLSIIFCQLPSHPQSSSSSPWPFTLMWMNRTICWWRLDSSAACTSGGLRWYHLTWQKNPKQHTGPNLKDTTVIWAPRHWVRDMVSGYWSQPCWFSGSCSNVYSPERCPLTWRVFPLWFF